jgi:hypothetical protein
MDYTLHSFIDEAIKLELNMSRLYSIFSEYSNEDRAFWNRLEIEEKNHAALLRTAKEFVNINRFPENLIPDDIETLVESNARIEASIDTYILHPNRESTFKIALELEKTGGEIHFQRFMEKQAEDNLTRIFQRLNRFDKDHSERILKYWETVTLGDNY